MSAGATGRPPLRAGYLGHLTLVANRMEGAAGRRPAVRVFLEASPEWQAYAAGPLQVCILLLSVSCYLVGRERGRRHCLFYAEEIMHRESCI